MAVSTNEVTLDYAGRNQISVSGVSGLAPSQVLGAGSGHCSKSSKHLRNFRVGTLNVNTLKGRVCEVVETLSRRKVDLCCVQETRYWGGHCRMITGKDSRYKLFWSGNSKGTAGVGVFVAEKWIEKVFEVKRVSDRPHLNQDTNWKVTNQQSYTTNESQEVSPLPAGDHKAQINRGTQTHAHNKHKPEKKHEISTKEVHLRTVRRKEGFNR